ncbi:HAMP domain-containing sensor histidine kinase [Actinokineospora sp. NBRC 105648]|uniref:HAMP domain-containing sensor histidine kinase n=1 Tax=Actinokineospora sp. NBRC 105648 TaxID=3032206 RepID=UPI0024A22845|nr:HAMP domain-containing sensor histidine kinase [Actinokineospora sp. NBRC 105648]GLZ42276.1 two-component sensor histidine kinase [Actinokineospora sp. NBRC 105648]
MSTDEVRPRRLGLRGRVMLTFAVGAALVSLLLAVSVFTISRGYLTDQRERSAQRLAAGDADFVTRRLTAPGGTPKAAVAALDPPAGTKILLQWSGEWVSADDTAPPDLPPDVLRAEVTGGSTGIVPFTVRDSPYLVTGIPLPDGGAFYEYAPVVELRSTIRILGVILAACAAAATISAALLGLWASRRVLRPLDTLARTAASIAGGNLGSRLPQEGDRDLSTIVSSFNTMVDFLQQRIDREQRFVGDVTHELRTPLTTLVTSVEVMRKHGAELPDRPRRALELVHTELDHLRRMLDDLLALARTEAGLHHDEVEPLSLVELLGHVLASKGYASAVLDATGDGVVPGRKLALVRAFTNLVDNAERHAGGVVRVVVRTTEERVLVHVDDDGPGVPEGERDRVFERFATGRGGRGSTAGTGLGLALVAETVAVHGGTVVCTDAPDGAARFTVALPRAPHD